MSLCCQQIEGKQEQAATAEGAHNGHISFVQVLLRRK